MRNVAFDASASLRFDFDAPVTSASLGTTSRSFGSGPSVFTSGDNIDLDSNFSASPGDCDVSVIFEFAPVPAFVDVTDTVSQFTSSPSRTKRRSAFPLISERRPQPSVSRSCAPRMRVGMSTPTGQLPRHGPLHSRQALALRGSSA